MHARTKSVVAGPALPSGAGGVQVYTIFEQTVHQYIYDAAVKGARET